MRFKTLHNSVVICCAMRFKTLHNGVVDGCAVHFITLQRGPRGRCCDGARVCVCVCMCVCVCVQVLLIGNAGIRPAVRALLFGPDCRFLPAPPHDAYRSVVPPPHSPRPVTCHRDLMP